METLRDLYNFYVSVYRPERSPQVRKNYGYNMEKHILKYLGDREINKLSLTELQLVVNQMKGMSATSIRSVVSDLKLVLRHAYMDEYISRDLSMYLTSPKKLESRGRRALTPVERNCVIEVAQTKRKYYAYLIMLLCGARPSEAFNIEREDFDFAKGTIHIRGTKTRLSDRVIPCPILLLNIARNSPSGLLTVSETGLRISKECQVRAWHSFFSDCHQHLGGKMYRNAPCEPYPFGKDITAYNLRHEYCTNLARNGVDIRITQRLMGHASPEMTLRVYTNLSNEDLDTEKVREVINLF